VLNRAGEMRDVEKIKPRIVCSAQFKHEQNAWESWHDSQSVY